MPVAQAIAFLDGAPYAGFLRLADDAAVAANHVVGVNAAAAADDDDDNVVGNATSATSTTTSATSTTTTTTATTTTTTSATTSLAPTKRLVAVGTVDDYRFRPRELEGVSFQRFLQQFEVVKKGVRTKLLELQAGHALCASHGVRRRACESVFLGLFVF